MVLKILDTVIGNCRVELNHCWVQLSPLLTLPLYILHSLSILFTLYSFPLPPLYSPFLHPLYTHSLTHLYTLPIFPQMTSPPLTLPFYINPLSTLLLEPWTHLYPLPTSPHMTTPPLTLPLYISFLSSLSISPTIKNCCDRAAQLPLGFQLVTPAPAYMNSLHLTLLL